MPIRPAESTDQDPSVNDEHLCRCVLPARGVYRFATRRQLVVVLGLAGDDELRILDEDGGFRTVAQHRVVLEQADAS